MNILMLSYEFPPLGGGGARVVANLSKELSSLGHRVDVVTMGCRGLPRYELVGGVHVHRVPCIRRRPYLCTMPEAVIYVLAAIPIVLRLIRRRNYVINHTHFIFPDGVLAWIARRFTGLPYLITAHGSDVPGYNPHRLKLAHRILTPLWHRVTKGALSIICPSDMLRELIAAHGVDAEKLIVIPNGMPLDKFRPDSVKDNVILIVTRMLERKGVQFVLEALRGLSVQPYEVHIVGNGPYLETLQAMAEQGNIPVKFSGWVDQRGAEFKAMYERARIFVFPSAAENCPLVLLEAMAAGLAIITSKGTGCAELVGDAALLVQPKNPSEIREALTWLMADSELCRGLGQAARRRLEERFSATGVAQQHAEWYERRLRWLAAQEALARQTIQAIPS